MEDFKPGLLKQVVTRDAANDVLARAGVMAIVLQAGDIQTGSRIQVVYPTRPHAPLQMI